MAVPGFGQHLDEVVLAGGCVLHFVDQQMLEMRTERRSEVVRSRVFAEDVAGKKAEFREVALVVLGENELKLNEGTAEDPEERFGDGPLVGWISGWWKSADGEKNLKQVVAIVELVDDGGEVGALWCLSCSNPT